MDDPHGDACLQGVPEIDWSEAVTSYVLGFLFSDSLSQVALIKKSRPKWQAGRINGLGGHVEDGEDIAAAMQREFFEESGMCIEDSRWTCFGRLHRSDWEVHLFYATSATLPLGVCDEGEVITVALSDLAGQPLMPGLRYLIPMALNHLQRSDACRYFDIQEDPGVLS